MKIVFYNPTHITFSSGPEVWLKNLLPELVSLGAEVILINTLFQYKESNISNELQLGNNGVHIINLPFYSLPFSSSPVPILKFHHKLEKIDVVYGFNGFAFQDLIAYYLSKKFKAKFIYGVRAPMYTGYSFHDIYQKYVSERLIRKAHKVHTMNAKDKISLSVLNQNFINTSHGVGKNFLNVKKIKKDNKFSIIFVGRLSPQKNISLLLDVIKKLNKDKFRVAIAGSGELDSLVQEAEKKMAHLNYLGDIDHAELPEVLSKYHCFLNLSKHETFCVGILEAMAAGLPIIATATNGMATDYGPSGLYQILPIDCESSEVVSSIYSLEEIYRADRPAYMAISKAAHSKAKKFSWSNQSKSFLKEIFD